MVDQLPRRRRSCTLGADRATTSGLRRRAAASAPPAQSPNPHRYGRKAAVRSMGAPPSPGYALSRQTQTGRGLWLAQMRRSAPQAPPPRAREVAWIFTFTSAAYNLVRLERCSCRWRRERGLGGRGGEADRSSHQRPRGMWAASIGNARANGANAALATLFQQPVGQPAVQSNWQRAAEVLRSCASRTDHQARW